MDFKFPDVGEGITEGEIVKWLVKEGDSVKTDEPIVEIETDKAVVDIPSPVPGTIKKIHHAAGDTIHVGETLVTITESARQEPGTTQQREERRTDSVVGFLEEGTEVLARSDNELKQKVDELSVDATPATRRLAKELGVSLSGIAGTGKEGRITEEDVRRASVHSIPAIKISRKYDLYGPVEHIPLKGVRKVIAKNLSKSAFTAVHVTHMDDCDVTELVAMRESDKKIAQKRNVRLTFMPYIIKAVVSALKEHPYLSATLQEDIEEITVKKYFNIGVAVDTDDGLIIPVVKIANRKDIYTIAKEVEELANKAKQRKLDLGDMKGGVFTITNVGSLGGVYATPVINPGECAILATGKIAEKPVVLNGKIVIRKILPLSLTFDHRIIDGAEGARFVNAMKQRLENPKTIMKEAEVDEEGGLG